MQAEIESFLQGKFQSAPGGEAGGKRRTVVVVVGPVVEVSIRPRR